MFQMMTIPNTERFLRIVEESRGDVVLHLPDDTSCSLKDSAVARQLLRVSRPGRSGLRLSLSDPADFPAFLKYMLEAGRERPA